MKHISYSENTDVVGDKTGDIHGYSTELICVARLHMAIWEVYVFIMVIRAIGDIF